MDSKIKPEDNSSNMKNANKGTSGTNRQYDQAMGNRGRQMQQQQAQPQQKVDSKKQP